MAPPRITPVFYLPDLGSDLNLKGTAIKGEVPGCASREINLGPEPFLNEMQQQMKAAGGKNQTATSSSPNLY
eukprot:CAMPEP_0201957730 /NCGR_PEP_ID=MMETSP0904-20121228/5047_1 /ASSEMBLY_ACC=CAM_ASM_000553 /TAXON_ID=420261 /ORGANISM="Thalassiosira antarctica, Strain CCMP982" /LENGTH=71 /DNA_ID=CAMNT_0048502851 /DNA_START=560 /DNA_END=774 /DNA_ORIENTATION=+